MKTILKVEIDYPGLKGFTIENPGHLPINGEIFTCQWEDFIVDSAMVKLIDEIEEDEYFRVERNFSKYSKDESMCFIVLHTSKDYKKHFPHNK
ncbi:hypothetical protein KDU71_14270 [Carboxylicivirga sediminis]|uniref:Uncharacterized protein n=1 Tax=Carboxylicivirga sediminis TaxID=2006564 RepID=A0A941F6A4_9BACT|nr:hypothetical protein [Carboxylicivirga sediminis]MBR8536738.1 hypothetical protein [Carboxylicivirga sediminis]